MIDSTPIQVRHWRRYGRTHLMLPEAALGYCAAKKETFYGYRLVVLTTLAGVITDWELIPANADEREADPGARQAEGFRARPRHRRSPLDPAPGPLRKAAFPSIWRHRMYVHPGGSICARDHTSVRSWTR